MTAAELDALDRLCQRVAGKVTVGEPDYLPSAGGHHVLLSDAEYRLYMAARPALSLLVAEVRRLRGLIDGGSFICTKCDEELSWHPEDPPHADHCVWYKGR